MATVITGIRNNTNVDFKLLVPGYNTSRPHLFVNALGIYDLFNYLTPDEIWAMQEQLEPLVRDGTLSITTTALFPFTPVTSLHADANNEIVGDVQLVSGTNITLSQTGAAIVVNSSGIGTFYKDFFVVITPSNPYLVLNHIPISNSQIVAWNGVLLSLGISNDYTISGNTIVLNSGISLTVGDQFEVTYSA